MNKWIARVLTIVMLLTTTITVTALGANVYTGPWYLVAEASDNGGNIVSSQMRMAIALYDDGKAEAYADGSTSPIKGSWSRKGSQMRTTGIESDIAVSINGHSTLVAGVTKQDAARYGVSFDNLFPNGQASGNDKYLVAEYNGQVLALSSRNLLDISTPFDITDADEEDFQGVWNGDSEDVHIEISDGTVKVSGTVSDDGFAYTQVYQYSYDDGKIILEPENKDKQNIVATILDNGAMMLYDESDEVNENRVFVSAKETGKNKKSEKQENKTSENEVKLTDEIIELTEPIAPGITEDEIIVPAEDWRTNVDDNENESNIDVVPEDNSRAEDKPIEANESKQEDDIDVEPELDNETQEQDSANNASEVKTEINEQEPDIDKAQDEGKETANDENNEGSDQDNIINEEIDQATPPSTEQSDSNTQEANGKNDSEPDQSSGNFSEPIEEDYSNITGDIGDVIAPDLDYENNKTENEDTDTKQENTEVGSNTVKTKTLQSNNAFSYYGYLISSDTEDSASISHSTSVTTNSDGSTSQTVTLSAAKTENGNKTGSSESYTTHDDGTTSQTNVVYSTTNEGDVTISEIVSSTKHSDGHTSETQTVATSQKSGNNTSGKSVSVTTNSDGSSSQSNETFILSVDENGCVVENRAGSTQYSDGSESVSAVNEYSIKDEDGNVFIIRHTETAYSDGTVVQSDTSTQLNAYEENISQSEGSYNGNTSESWAVNSGYSDGESAGQSFSIGYGINQGYGYGVSDTDGNTSGYGVSTSYNPETGESYSSSYSYGTSSNQTEGSYNGNTSENWSSSFGYSVGESSGINVGSSYSVGYGENVSSGQSYSTGSGTSQGYSYGTSDTDGNSSGYGVSTSYNPETGESYSVSYSYGTNSSQSVSSNYNQK